MKKLISVVLLLAGLTFAYAADKYAPTGNTLTDALQWLAVQTACVGQYSNAQIGEYWKPDPRDNYQPSDIGQYLAARSGNRTRTSGFYGICFDYAQTAYNTISASRSYYEGLGMKSGQWYIAAAFQSSREIVLFRPVAQGQHTMVLNGEYVKEIARFNVRTHDDATIHGWLWVYANDGTIYWIDPTWTDIEGYVWWGVVRNGREEKLAPTARLCASSPPSSSAFASFTSGDANRNSGRYDEAIVDYDETIRVEPNYAAGYNNRGRSYYAKGDYDRAIADFNQAITLDPKYVDAYYSRGLAYYAKRDYDRAMADYNQAITLDPEFALAYNGRAYVYLARKDHERAYADVRQMVKLAPNEILFTVTAGEIFLDMENYNRAIQFFELALRLMPSYTRAKELLERARRRGR
jgi:tetratricopeptide (TPR) repeat protein